MVSSEADVLPLCMPGVLISATFSELRKNYAACPSMTFCLVSLRGGMRPLRGRFTSNGCSSMLSPPFTYLGPSSPSSVFYVVVQSPSRVRIFVTARTAACQASLSLTTSWNLPKLMSIELVTPSNHLIFCCPLPLLLSVFPSIGGFSSESAVCIRWPKCWSFSLAYRKLEPTENPFWKNIG